jgi:SAM-dependent methyltransferase
MNEFVEKIACVICGNDQNVPFEDGTKNLNLEKPLAVVRCINCGVLFMSPRPSAVARQQIFDNRKPPGFESYLSNLAKYGSVTKERLPLFRKRVEFLRKQMGNRKISVLDIGASSGEFLQAAIELGCEATGVEPSAEGVRIAKSKGLNVVQSPAETLPFPDETFDLVHSNHVFEHLADPQQAAKEAFRVLKKDGLFFVEVPNQFDNINFFRYRLMGRVPVRERNVRSIHHLFFLSRKSMKKLLSNAGFKEISVNDVYGRKRSGIAYLASDFMRFIGMFYLGGPIIQGIGKKSTK